jgi:hypothetical protein
MHILMSACNILNECYKQFSSLSLTSIHAYHNKALRLKIINEGMWCSNIILSKLESRR